MDYSAPGFTSKMSIVDLAGSERLKKTKAEEERKKEGIKINGGETYAVGAHTVFRPARSQ